MKIGTFIALVLFIIYVPFSQMLDLAATGHFYQNGFPSNWVFNFVYNWGMLPAVIVAFWGGCMFLASFVRPRLRHLRLHGLVLFLTLAIGSGLIVHAIFKDHWGRPRPKQVEAFGGAQQYHPFYQPDFFNPIPSKSFPCGHCSCGFYFFALVFVGRQIGSKKLEYLGWLLALGLGIILSWTRIAQGGHWLSDTMVTAWIMWFTAWGCANVIYRDQRCSL